MRTFIRPVLVLATLALSIGAAPAARAQTTAAPVETFASKTAGLRKIDGFVPLYWDDAHGRMLMEISRFGTEILYQESLASGIGSNPVGLDRSQLGSTRVVTFERIGPRVLMIEPNWGYRALTTNPAERRAVADSYASSVLWGFAVEVAEGDRVLVDATPFLLRDAHGVVGRLRDTGQGNYSLDANRSVVSLPGTKGFPKNTEVEALLTYATDGTTGPYVNQTAANPQAITIRQHHSFVELPGPGFTPRAFDPRVGFIQVEFADYASPITSQLEKRWVLRHRIQKRDPSAAVSDPIEPIVYYVDSGAPEEVRNALIEGASWWNQAFEAAGFRNGFQVRVLPDGVDPMDIRYNVISWVHRSTRGWSYGTNVVDPRTGEIIKGNVVLDSLRVRQDYTIGAGMVAPGGGPTSCSFSDAPDFSYLADGASSDAARKMALARIRQLAAHEVGHAIGLEHNFAASTYGRASVMDYPAPIVRIHGSTLDLTDAYATGIGAYDKFAITWGYGQFPAGADEAAELDRMAGKAASSGMLFLTDSDARPAGAADPLASLWDNGDDAVASLRHEMDVRRIGLERFGLGSIADGEPVSLLEMRLLPLYLHHRYQLQAAVKTIGGATYEFSIKTPAGPVPGGIQRIIPAAAQRDAIAAVLETIDPATLTLPVRILDLLPPAAAGWVSPRIEVFPKRTDPVFDPIGVATIAADLAVSGLLEPHRAARCESFHARDKTNPGFTEVVDALVTASWTPGPSRSGYQAAVARAIQQLVAVRLMGLAANADADPQVRAIAADALRRLSARLRAAPGIGDDGAHRRAVRDEIDRFLSRPSIPAVPVIPQPAPQGDPIGTP